MPRNHSLCSPRRIKANLQILAHHPIIHGPSGSMAQVSSSSFDRLDISSPPDHGHPMALERWPASSIFSLRKVAEVVFQEPCHLLFGSAMLGEGGPPLILVLKGSPTAFRSIRWWLSPVDWCPLVVVTPLGLLYIPRRYSHLNHLLSCLCKSI